MILFIGIKLWILSKKWKMKRVKRLPYLFGKILKIIFFSIKFGKTKAYQWKIMLKICEETKNRIFDGEIMEKIEEIEEKINIFKIKVNSVRSKNTTLECIYLDGKEINRTEEIRKGNS